MSKAKRQIRGGAFGGSQIHGQTIYCTIPYINADIPLTILFRALNVCSDKEIVERIVFDEEDQLMMEALRPSLEEGTPFLEQEDALNYIGMRGHASGTSREERIDYARKILQEDFLPHVTVSEDFEMKKSYFVGYMVYRLLNAHLGRASEDDRDHYGKKRLDMAGSLLASLFHHLFRDFIRDARRQF